MRASFVLTVALLGVTACSGTKDGLIDPNKPARCPENPEPAEVCPTVPQDVVTKCGCPPELISMHQAACEIRGLAIGDIKTCYTSGGSFGLQGQKIIDLTTYACKDRISRLDPNIGRAIEIWAKNYSGVTQDPAKWRKECYDRLDGDWIYQQCKDNERDAYNKVKNGQYRLMNFKVTDNGCGLNDSLKGFEGQLYSVFVEHNNGAFQITRRTDSGEEWGGFGQGRLTCNHAQTHDRRLTKIHVSKYCYVEIELNADATVSANSALHVDVKQQNLKHTGPAGKHCENIPPCTVGYSFDLHKMP